MKRIYFPFQLSVVCMMPYSEARPGFSIKQVRRNLNTIWKDGKDYEKPRRKKKMRIRQRELTSLYDTEVFSNCRAVRMTPGHSCRNLVYKNGAVCGIDEPLVGDQGMS